jgi:Spondin_N
MIKKLALGLLLPAFGASFTQAADVSVSVENLTRGMFFTPLAVAAHPENSPLFTLGASASDQIQAMAEGGDLSGIETALTALGATQSNNPAAGLLIPGASTSTTLNTDGTSNVMLSIVGMILPSNDGFIALNNIEIPTAAGSYTYYAKAYDAGTEANDEIVGSGAVGEAGFPAPGPVAATLGSNGTGVMTTAEGFIHIHRGALGDLDASGGVSDLDSTAHRWLNPIAKITVTVSE